MLGLTLQLGLASRARRLPQRLPAANISVGKPGLLLGGSDRSFCMDSWLYSEIPLLHYS